MTVKTVIKKGLYFDSVKLMGISSKVSATPGVAQGIVCMATIKNKEMIANFGIDISEIDDLAPTDLVIVINAESEESAAEAVACAEDLLSGGLSNADDGKLVATSIEEALDEIDLPSIAVISIPGAYAAKEVRKALDADLHVMLFSDNVSIEDEVELKQYAHDKGLFLMGPDCGTSIISGVALCFANKVRKGPIGTCGASGTGGQELTSLIHNMGGGITHFIGTGGRDLSKEVGGIMMLDGLDGLIQHEKSEVIVLVSKPPIKEVEEKILERAGSCDKPVVICFINGQTTTSPYENIHFVHSLEEAAEMAVKLADSAANVQLPSFAPDEVEAARATLKPRATKIRGLFAGGTLCAEAAYRAKNSLADVYSNTFKQEGHVDGFEDVSGHVFIDFGEDEYTDGKPHPMIDPSTRNEHLKAVAKDPETGIILMDFVLGYGSHEDPVGASLEAIEAAKKTAADDGRKLVIIGYLCGTDRDIQGYEDQKQKLLDAGAYVASSNVRAADFAISIAS